jgi:hypothetical protein
MSAPKTGNSLLFRAKSLHSQAQRCMHDYDTDAAVVGLLTMSASYSITTKLTVCFAEICKAASCKSSAQVSMRLSVLEALYSDILLSCAHIGAPKREDGSACVLYLN